MARFVPVARIAARLHASGSLSRKLTLFYALLFGAAVALMLGGARWGIDRYAERAVRAELQAGGEIFDRITTMRYSQLADAGRVLAIDYGFRAAVASADAPTIESALDSLKRRLVLDQAFVVTIDGDLIGYRGRLDPRQAERLPALLDQGADRGVLRLGDRDYAAIAAPVEAPMLLGWVVFAKSLDEAEMTSLSQLTAFKLKPEVRPVDRVERALRDPAARAGIERIEDGERILIQTRPIQSFDPAAAHLLVLQFSLTDALGQYRPIFNILAILGIIGVIVAVTGSAFLARAIARPVRELDRAAQRVSAGEQAQVPVSGNDELGRLAQSFNQMVVDIDARERQIAHMAFHDSLTGLPNRALLREHVQLVLKNARSARRMALFCLDLDNFKAVNDTLGHPVGDALLCEIGARLRTLVGDDGFVARLGGDEFALLLPEHRPFDRIAHDIIDTVARPAQIDGHRIVPGTTVGVAIASLDGSDVTTLLKNADLALYRAKSEGKNCARFFEAAMDAEARARREMELDLHDALNDGRLFLMFQPLFNLAESRVAAFEALLRWNHPTRGLVSPVEFIPLAEDTGLIVPIGEWVLREACRMAIQLPENVRVAVNISPVQFRNPGLNATILSALADSGLDPGRLELEITESLFIDNIEATLASLHSLRALGVRVALDDFGTGYSSLSYLRSFPFDKLKIDRSFIIDLMANEGATAIIRSITTLADALGMETTAEGVENVEQLDILREQGCSQIQGFYFSKPLPADELKKLFDRDERKVA
ncbi:MULTISPECIES: putative bifunctional diguanylate cyclase/phosphodiesterase [unclassified Sphingomonas]|jgi:diguanylate cyclase (GGDEF)-like protein|uniref:putative bifunctional diguanylate cyclase/phosphodiesterase n=1 Tax=unclassified Sphingomonas TaxID=196159 RepID=UPI00082EAAC0|nr:MULTISPECIES: EAL domain-containing protein [unclassified Sphingomonas]